MGYEVVSSSVDKLSRGKVWCKVCGASHGVNSEHALRHGWPKCCGYTMTIDSPEERKAAQEPHGHTS